MENNRLIKALAKIRDLAEIALNGGKVQHTGRKPAKGTTAKAASTSNKLPHHIIGLRDSEFFKQPKTGNEVRTKLQATYACDLDRVMMALLRLADKKQLR